jgi:hypothetical protein
MSDYFSFIILNNNIDTIAQLFRCKCRNMYLSKLDLKEDMYCMFFFVHVLFRYRINIWNGWFLCEFYDKGFFKYQ